VARYDQRQGFLISLLVHSVIVMSLASHPRVSDSKETAPSPDPGAAARRVFLPPPATLRRLMPAPAPRAPRPPAAAPAPAPRPTPPPSPEAKDKISVGADRAKGPMILRKDEEISAAKGKPNATPATPPPPAPTTPSSEAVAKAGDRVETPKAPGFRLPPGVAGDLPRGQDGSRKGAGPQPASVASSVEDIVRRMDESGPHGLPSGAGKQMGGLFFDPEGADFTAWINHFKNEVYRNWIVPLPAQLNFRGHVDIEFTVERDGTMTNLRLEKSAGQPAMDRAAQNALVASRFLPLPGDFRPQRVTMHVSFLYNEGPSGT
jgi:colicin import membrane protein